MSESEPQPEPDSLQGCVRGLVTCCRRRAAAAAHSVYVRTGEDADGNPVYNCDHAQLEDAMARVRDEIETEHFGGAYDLSLRVRKEIEWRKAVDEF